MASGGGGPHRLSVARPSHLKAGLKLRALGRDIAARGSRCAVAAAGGCWPAAGSRLFRCAADSTLRSSALLSAGAAGSGLTGLSSVSAGLVIAAAASEEDRMKAPSPVERRRASLQVSTRPGLTRSTDGDSKPRPRGCSGPPASNGSEYGACFSGWRHDKRCPKTTQIW